MEVKNREEDFEPVCFSAQVGALVREVNHVLRFEKVFDEGVQSCKLARSRRRVFAGIPGLVRVVGGRVVRGFPARPPFALASTQLRATEACVSLQLPIAQQAEVLAQREEPSGFFPVARGVRQPGFLLSSQSPFVRRLRLESSVGSGQAAAYGWERSGRTAASFWPSAELSGSEALTVLYSDNRGTTFPHDGAEAGREDR